MDQNMWPRLVEKKDKRNGKRERGDREDGINAGLWRHQRSSEWIRSRSALDNKNCSDLSENLIGIFDAMSK